MRNVSGGKEGGCLIFRAVIVFKDLQKSYNIFKFKLPWTVTIISIGIIKVSNDHWVDNMT